MANRPANLIAYAQALLGWPIVVGSPVVTNGPEMGDDNDGVERTVEAGGSAKVDRIEWFSGEQRLAITIVIDVEDAPLDSDGDPNTITATFDEADDPDHFFHFVQDTRTEKQDFMVLVRGMSHATKEVPIKAVSRAEAQRAALGMAKKQDFEWDLSAVEDIQVEGFA